MYPQHITLGLKAKNLMGQRFGRLTILAPVGRNRYGRILWACRCDCGNEATVEGAVLRRKQGTQSCGCLNKERARAANRTHGLREHPTYKSWKGMKERCLNPSHHKYPRYGGRGIKIYLPWAQSFEAFYEYVSALPHCGEKGYTLDRINNDGNYEPDNVRWATAAMQNRNTHQNVMLTHNGVTLCATDWAERLGMDAKVLRNRIARGWTTERALTQRARRSPIPRR